MSNAEYKERIDEQLVEDSKVAEMRTEESEAVQTHIGSTDEKSLIGALIGQHYEILELLGEGGMSKVYKARHMILDEPVALKVISGHFTNEAKTLRRFRQEAVAATQLKHPNICSVREFGVDDGKPFLVMEFIDGTSLDDLLEKEKQLDTSRALHLLLDVCEGLEYAHKRNVIHRDIKPANLILRAEKDGSTSVEIVDFGIAKLIREDDSGPNLTATGEVFGTPNYMSPEQCLGKVVDKRSDIYSVGCVLFHLVSGHPPFAADSVLETLMKQVNESPERLRGDAESINPIIQKCMKKHANDRYQSIADLKSDIKRILAGERLAGETPADNDIADGDNGQRIADVHIPQNETKPRRNPVLVALICIIIALTSTIVINNIVNGSKRSTTPTNTSPQNIESALTPNSSWAKTHHEADLLHRKGDTTKALALYEEAYELAVKGQARPAEVAYLAEETAGCARYLNDAKKAIKYYGIAAQQAKSMGDFDWQQRMLGGLARSEFEQKMFDEGLKHYDEILKIQLEAVGDDPIIMAYWRIAGTAYMDAGRPVKAEPYFKKVLELSKQFPGAQHQQVALAHYELGRIAAINGQKDVAKLHYETALKMGRLSWLQTDEIRKIEDALNRVK